MNIRIIRKRNNKKVYLRVVNGEVVVTAPFSVSKQEINLFIQKNQVWIQEQLNQHPFLKEGDHVSILEKDYIIQYKNDRYMIDGIDLDAFIYSHTTVYITKRVHYFCNELKIQEPTLSFKYYKSRWGSCRKDQNALQFNLNLAYTNFSFIDAIILHEIAHLFVSNHGKDFYDLLTTWMPEYRTVISQKFIIPKKKLSK